MVSKLSASSGLALTLAALVAALLVCAPLTHAANIGGYDIDITYPDMEQARHAVEQFDAPNSGYHVTHVDGTTVSIYTRSEMMASSVMKRSGNARIREVQYDYTGYYTYETMTAKLKEWNTTFPNVFRMWTLGKSVEGRELWAVQVSTTPDDEMNTKPNVKYIGNMHGDEVVGRELLMRFIERMLFDHSPDMVEFVSKTNTYVVPTMNPDGFADASRGNANGYDLNRNFPDQYRRPNGPEQPETKLIRAFIASRQWTLSANYHGGDVVANYPWDGRPDDIFSKENKSPDDDMFRNISKVYARTNPGMMNNWQFKDGITNGAAWYVLFGGMQDYNYIHHGCPEITLEVSKVKFPLSTQVPGLWEHNKVSMLEYMKLAHHGVRGVVYDAQTKRPIAGAAVTVAGREITHVKTRKTTGLYFRILLPGSWTVTYSAPGYVNTTLTVKVPTPSAMAANAFPRAGEHYVVENVYLARSANFVETPSTTIIANPQLVEGAKEKPKVLISTSDNWVIPFFAVLGCFAALAVVLVAFVAFQSRGVNITGGASFSTATLPELDD